ncbi:class I SAM-dependent methyltransferase, partial [Gammaproteobacteria bacterium]|nr:class I SAM-dependent methyltransferase [Gammaproteobacteria bacterium]
MARLPINFVQCVACSHIWNRSFNYDDIPYRTNPNRMYNKGSNWQGFLAQTRSMLIEELPSNPTVVEIGCGDGHFIRGLADSLDNKGSFLGFDPSTSSESGQGIEFYPRLFEPMRDVEELKPDLIIMRHVLEHLTRPDEFLQSLAWASMLSNKEVKLYAEVPSVDRVFYTYRLSDFFYEHFSHFCTSSFRKLLEGAGSIIKFQKGYDAEVMFGLVSMRKNQASFDQAGATARFYERSQTTLGSIQKQMKELSSSGKKIAIWGGTGKAAAFINYFGATRDLFPLVVDSDKIKAGQFVPGTGQRIKFFDVLKEEKPEIVIIPAAWRARDIVAEMQRHEILVEKVLIEHEGKLINFHNGSHPY